MTRARDELILTHAVDYGGRRARRVSPFVLEALDLRPADPSAAVGSGPSSPLERLAAFAAAGARRQPARRSSPPEPLSLSFDQVDDYLGCPLKYRYVHVVRVPVAPHHSIVYGSALHAAVQEFHRRQGRGEIMTEAELVAAFEAAWTNEGFLTREHEEARLDGRSGRPAPVPRGAAPARTRSSRPTSSATSAFTLDGDRIRGRWDRVDIEPGDRGAPAERRRAGPASPPDPSSGGRRPTSSSPPCRSCRASGSRSPTTSRATCATRSRRASGRGTRSS